MHARGNTGMPGRAPCALSRSVISPSRAIHLRKTALGSFCLILLAIHPQVPRRGSPKNVSPCPHSAVTMQTKAQSCVSSSVASIPHPDGYCAQSFDSSRKTTWLWRETSEPLVPSYLEDARLGKWLYHNLVYVDVRWTCCRPYDAIGYVLCC